MDPLSLPELSLEMQRYVVSEVTNLDAALNFFQISPSFRALADHIIELKSNQEKEITVDEIKHFPKLQSLTNIVIRITSADDINKLKPFKDLRHVVFCVESDNPDDLISTYLTQHRHEFSSHSEFKRWMVFMIPGTGSSNRDVLVYDHDRIWLTSPDDLKLSIQVLTQCTRIASISFANDGIPKWLQNSDLNIVTYQIPVGKNKPKYYSHQVINFFKQVYLGVSDPFDPNSPPLHQLLTLLKTSISKRLNILTLVEIYGMVNDLLTPTQMVVTKLMKSWFNISQDYIEIINFVNLLSFDYDKYGTDISIKLTDPEILVEIGYDHKVINNVCITYKRFPHILQSFIKKHC